jgi:glycosyltransferase involved in cell wall biosynthesis
MGFRSMLAAVYRRLSKKRTVLLIWADVSEATEKGRGTARKIIRRLLRTATDCFIVNSESGRRYLSSVGVPQDRMFRVPYATDLQTFWCSDVTRSRAAARKLLYVGQLSERKGLAPFVQELAKWCQAHSRQRVQFTLLGDGPLRPALARLSVPENLHVSFLDPLPYSQVVNAYRDAGILVLPTLADTWGLVVNEGMAAGLPVLGSVFSPAVEEMVADNVNGWTFRPDDPESLRNALDRCMGLSDDSLQQMRAHAQTSAARFSPDHIAALISDAIRHCKQRAHGTTEQPDA